MTPKRDQHNNKELELQIESFMHQRTGKEAGRGDVHLNRDAQKALTPDVREAQLQVHLENALPEG